MADAEAHRDRVVVVFVVSFLSSDSSPPPGRLYVRIPNLPYGLGRRELAPKPFLPIRYDPDDQAPFSPRSALCGGLGVCPGPEKCYERINDDRATYKEGVRAAYKCADGPPGSKWNLAAADTPPSKRVGRRAYKRAREELAMLQREAQPKQKPVKTL